MLSNTFQTVIKELNRLGMIIDLSHSSRQTAMDALETSEAPVIFSHSSAFALCNSTRNVPDDLLKLVVSFNEIERRNQFTEFDSFFSGQEERTGHGQFLFRLPDLLKRLQHT